MSGPRRVVVAISGATGVVYGVRALELLREVDDVETHLVITGPGRQTLAYETDLSPADVEGLADVVHGSRDIAAPISSGSYATAGMIIAPCSIKMLSAVANSFGADLVSRAADVTLKERRPLVLMVRETPLHLGHLRLMVQAAEIGAVVYPPVPAFYTRPESITDIVDHSVVRALGASGCRGGRDPPLGGVDAHASGQGAQHGVGGVAAGSPPDTRARERARARQEQPGYRRPVPAQFPAPSEQRRQRRPRV